MSDLKIGIIGTGMISGMFCDAVEEVDSVTVGAVLSRSEERGEGFVRENRLDCAVFTDFEAFAGSGIDAVYVASPNCLHMKHTIESVRRRLHVLCEKPIASDAGEYAEMRREAEKCERILLEAMRPAHDPCYVIVRENLPRLGTLRRAALEYCQYASRYDRFKAGESPRAFDPAYSNAAVMDIGVYPISVCVSLFGAPSGEIKSRSVILRGGMEGAGEAILPYGDMTAVISYSKIHDSVNPSVISGEGGSIIIDKLSSPKKIVFIGRDGKEEVLFTSEKDNNMRYEIRAFVEAIRKGEADSKFGDDTAITISLIDEIRRQNGIRFPADVK